MGPGEKQNTSREEVMTSEIENDEEYIDLLLESMTIENNLEDSQLSEEDEILKRFGY